VRQNPLIRVKLGQSLVVLIFHCLCQGVPIKRKLHSFSRCLSVITHQEQFLDCRGQFRSPILPDSKISALSRLLTN
jgi:hypothetical protein